MLNSYFSAVEQTGIAAASAMTLAACISFHQRKDRRALILLLLSAVIIRMVIIHLDPFLHMWDEAVHALVAKNMVDQPFKPMLFKEEALGLGHEGWLNNHVWLHKQPFALWMIALSIKAFGNTLVAVRLPSVLFSTALVYFTFGIARAMHGRRNAFAAAIIVTWSYWILMMVLGSIATDHNDVIFITLVAGSIWAWVIHMERGSNNWALLAGLLVGLAILTKWLPGLLVFLGWTMVAIRRTMRRERPRSTWRSLFMALGLALLVTLPWQIHAAIRFPVEMAHEMAYNTAHLTTPIEGHRGGPDYYWSALRDQFAPFSPWVLLVGLVVSAWTARNKDLALMMVTSVAFVLTFYTLVATKMENYVLIILPFCTIALARLVDLFFMEYLLRRWAMTVFLFVSVITGFAMFRIEQIQLFHTDQYVRDPYQAWYRGCRLQNTNAIELVWQQVRGLDQVIIFNVGYPENISMTFFHGPETIHYLPDSAVVGRLKSIGYIVAIVDPPEDLDAAVREQCLLLRLGDEGFCKL